MQKASMFGPTLKERHQEKIKHEITPFYAKLSSDKISQNNKINNNDSTLREWI